MCVCVCLCSHWLFLYSKHGIVENDFHSLFSPSMPTIHTMPGHTIWICLHKFNHITNNMNEWSKGERVIIICLCVSVSFTLTLHFRISVWVCMLLYVCTVPQSELPCRTWKMATKSRKFCKTVVVLSISLPLTFCMLLYSLSLSHSLCLRSFCHTLFHDVFLHWDHCFGWIP